MDKTKLSSNKDNFIDWYQEVIERAELAEHAPIRGCMTIRPYGCAIWEAIHDDLDKRFKKRGVKNACFPLLIPESYFAREKTHVDGFSPEFAVVTHAGGKPLDEPLIIRPTSETIIHESMKNWIKSYRDLPMRLNQWCSVVRWEKRPRLFLRSSEFWWQEGHVALATEKEARNEMAEMLQSYGDFSEQFLAIPVIRGRKSESEKFAGAIETRSIEGLMPDGKALQLGTSHYLGQGFAKVAGVEFLDKDMTKKFVELVSWGVTTRLIGAVIMVHGDDKGLVLPPRLAPVQVVIIPIGEVLDYAESIKTELEKFNIRVEIDSREEYRPGAKYYDHEVRGVPIRFEIGKRENESNTITAAIRHSGVKQQFDVQNIGKNTSKLLETIQEEMLKKATESLHARIITAKDKTEFEQLIADQAGFIRANWCGETECEFEIKAKTLAVTRSLPLHEHCDSDKCIWCGKPSKHLAYFAKAY
jgi:prolyl-tRNA synthetase